MNSSATTRAPAATPTLTHTLTLPAGTAHAFNRLQDVEIASMSGILWITEEGRHEDRIVGPGQSHWLEARTRIVVTALNGAAQFTLRHRLPSRRSLRTQFADSVFKPLWQGFIQRIFPTPNSATTTARHWAPE